MTTTWHMQRNRLETYTGLISITRLVNARLAASGQAMTQNNGKIQVCYNSRKKMMM